MRYPAYTAVALLAVLVSAAHAGVTIENATFSANSNGGAYGPITDWTQTPYPSGLGGFDYLSGTSNSGQFPWDNGTVPGQGTSGQVGFIQVYAGVSTLSLEQTVTGFTVGQTYTLSYYENSRAGTTTPIVDVLVGGNVVVAPHLDPAVGGSNPFRLETSIPFVATATSLVVQLQSSQSSPNTDATATFGNISISQITPEPASFVMWSIGIAACLFAARRRRKA